MTAYLHLDPQFQPFGSGLNYESFTFSGGELHIRITEDFSSYDRVMITSRPRSFNDMGMILLAADALKRGGTTSLELFLPYFPAARQDRLMVEGEALSVKVYADLINAVGFEKVIVFDPHSDVTPAVLNRVEVVSNHRFVQSVVRDFDQYCLVSPDGGALKKVHKLAQVLVPDQVIECSKVRDVRSGKLQGFTVYADNLNGMNCLIVDDICDGGGTFLGLADELKRKGAGRLVLVVSHGIFSKGTDELLKKFDMIYTTDSFQNIENESIKMIYLNDLLI